MIEFNENKKKMKKIKKYINYKINNCKKQEIDIFI